MSADAKPDNGGGKTEGKAGKVGHLDATLDEMIDTERRAIQRLKKDVHERCLALAALLERQPYTAEDTE